MRVLDKKLFRDFKRLWPQAMAVSLVLACGIATLIMAIGAYQSLIETRRAYYERYRFATVFASATRAPQSLARDIAAIRGVSAVQVRIVKPAMLDVIGMNEPATAKIISIADNGQPVLNRFFLRSGRLPHADRKNEVIVSEAFALAHGFKAGSEFSGTLSGHKVMFKITGLALSPEYIYALGPGDLVPDHSRFAIIWMPEKQLAGMTDLEDAFNSVALKLLPGVEKQAVIDRLDELLKPYGGTGAILRKDQTSNAFLTTELTNLKAMARIIPPIFLFVSAYLINMIMSRLIELEREQIGLLKALGFSGFEVAVHYLKLVFIIAMFGIIIGFIAGTWLGRGLTNIYADIFKFPFLIFLTNPAIYVLSAFVGIFASLVGAFKSIRAAAILPPAVAMKPAAPPIFRKSGIVGRLFDSMFSQLTIMALRQMIRWPIRAGLTILGTAMAVSLLITSMFIAGSINFMIDTVFFSNERQDATISFTQSLHPRAEFAVRQLPGVEATEPFRIMLAEITFGSHTQRLAITGKTDNPRLSRVLDLNLDPVSLPTNGLMLNERVAAKLQVRRGDIVSVKLLEESGYETTLPVVDIDQSYVGMGASMNLAAMSRLSKHGPRISGVYAKIDSSQRNAIYKILKTTPNVASIGLQDVSLKKMRGTIEQNIKIMTRVYFVLAVIVAFGVVYNTARILLSERARELASLRVLGFTRWEVSTVLIVEMTMLVLLAQPIGWLLGYGFSWVVILGFKSDLFRIPFVVQTQAFGWASMVVIIAAIISAISVLWRVRRLDMIRVLKTRE